MRGVGEAVPRYFPLSGVTNPTTEPVPVPAWPVEGSVNVSAYVQRTGFFTPAPA